VLRSFNHCYTVSLFTATTRYLHPRLLTQLAWAAALPEPEAAPYAEAVVAALARQLAQPTNPHERRARWLMCQQLYRSQLLTDSAELLRADLGWPDRRRYLAQRLLGPAQVTNLAATTQHPAAATSLLGLLTILTLAVAGAHASQASLDPAGLARWLRQAPAPSAGLPVVSAPRAGRPLQLAATLSSLALLGLGSYLAVGPAARPLAQPVPARSLPVRPVVAASVPQSAAPMPAPAATAPLDTLAAPVPEAALVVGASTPAPAAPLATREVSSKPAAAKKPAASFYLRDTLGNAAMARAIGGRFDVAQGHYPRGEGQPLIIKLVDRVTLTVGINSTESLLYKRLVNPALPRPADLVLDRLTFANSRATLGAEGAQQLGSVASLLKTFPKARVLVLGHANIAEDEATKLGLKRATAAVEELRKQGIDPSRVQAQGALATGIPTDNDPAERVAMLQGISLKISRL
jgi:outer membrane protein OmpA-like peptidoglycan-associated protein